MKISVVVFCCVLVGAAFAKPAKEGKKEDRVHDRPLSDVEHNEDDEDEHDPAYDHESFLGKDDSKKFDQLSPEESKERLSKIVKEKIDKDKDGFVTSDELRNWIQYISRRYLVEDADRQWAEYTTTDGKLSWEEYSKKATSDPEDDSVDDHDAEDAAAKKSKDEKRFKKADKDNDGLLTKEEFIDFLHPEEAPHMKDIVVDETMDDIDKNKDGFIDMEEYINDMWSPTDGEKEPDWLKTERDQFTNQRDKDKDGKLNREEVKAWIMPEDHDHVNAETNHLIQQSDVDKDGKLSHQEILDKYDVFVGSQATDFGDVLKRHEEL